MYHIKKNGGGEGGGGGRGLFLKLWTEIYPLLDEDQIDR